MGYLARYRGSPMNRLPQKICSGLQAIGNVGAASAAMGFASGQFCGRSNDIVIAWQHEERGACQRREGIGADHAP